MVGKLENKRMELDYDLSGDSKDGVDPNLSKPSSRWPLGLISRVTRIIDK